MCRSIFHLSAQSVRRSEGGAEKYRTCAAQDLGFNPKRGAEISPVSLATGYGADVLEVLTWLSMSVFERQIAGEIHARVPYRKGKNDQI